MTGFLATSIKFKTPNILSQLYIIQVICLFNIHEKRLRVEYPVTYIERFLSKKINSTDHQILQLSILQTI